MESVNEDRLREITWGDPVFEAELLAEFDALLADVAPKIAEAILAGELSAAGRYAHTIKGSAGAIGAQELQKHAASLCEACSQQASENAMTLVREFMAAAGKFHSWHVARRSGIAA